MGRGDYLHRVVPVCCDVWEVLVCVVMCVMVHGVHTLLPIYFSASWSAESLNWSEGKGTKDMESALSGGRQSFYVHVSE